MKNKNLIIPSILLAFVFFSGCQKENPVTPANSPKTNQNLEKSFNVRAYNFDSEADRIAESAFLAKHAQSNIVASRSQSIFVPDDYATIQEAVDAAPEGANIFVKEGTYTESVYIYTAGLKIQAQGDVQVNGAIRVRDDADNVVIKKFHINVPGSETVGFSSLNNSGVQFVQNTVTGPAGTGSNGILGVNVKDMIIRDNAVSGVDWGLALLTRSDLGSGEAFNNKVFNNTFSDDAMVAIQLQGNADNNMVWNNTMTNIVSDPPDAGNPAITLLGPSELIGAPPELIGDCNNNIIKDNVVSNSAFGIGVAFDSHDNTIGPDNNFSSNVFVGIYFFISGPDNLVYENTALNNGFCDILIDTSPGNIFRDNTYDCFTEL